MYHIRYPNKVKGRVGKKSKREKGKEKRRWSYRERRGLKRKGEDPWGERRGKRRGSVCLMIKCVLLGTRRSVEGVKGVGKEVEKRRGVD